MDPNNPAYHIDWIFCNNKPFHVANNLGWFKTFGPYRSSMRLPGDNGDPRGPKLADVKGMGDVELTMKTHPTRNGRDHQNIILLRNVLYVPSNRCNILGGPVLDGNTLNLVPKTDQPSKLKDDHTGATIALFDLPSEYPKLWRLRLRGQSPNQSSLRHDMSNRRRSTSPASKSDDRRPAHPDKAKRRTHHKTSSSSSGTKKLVRSSVRPTPLLTTEEKDWLRGMYGSERVFHYTEEDEWEDEHDLHNTSDFYQDIVADPTAHTRDMMFTLFELGWMQKYYWHASNFMRVHGLKPYLDEDCREARRIVRAKMAVQP